jgi:hypothetical protein
MLESCKWQRPVNKNLFVINLIWKHLLSTKWKFQSFDRRVRCFHWNQNGKWQIVVIWEHSGAIFVCISWITCAPCKTSSDWIRVLVAVTNEIINSKAQILKMYSRSAKGGEKGDPNRNSWLAKMGPKRCVSTTRIPSSTITGRNTRQTLSPHLVWLLQQARGCCGLIRSTPDLHRAEWKMLNNNI